MTLPKLFPDFRIAFLILRQRACISRPTRKDEPYGSSFLVLHLPKRRPAGRVPQQLLGSLELADRSVVAGPLVADRSAAGPLVADRSAAGPLVADRSAAEPLVADQSAPAYSSAGAAYALAGAAFQLAAPACRLVARAYLSAPASWLAVWCWSHLVPLSWLQSAPVCCSRPARPFWSRLALASWLRLALARH